MAQFNEPILMADGRHGIYMTKLVIETWLNQPFFAKQLHEKLTKEEINDLLDIDAEYHAESVENLTDREFMTPDGKPFRLEFFNGDLWAVPEGYEFPEE